MKKLIYNRVKIVATAHKVTDGGAKTTPTAYAVVLRCGGVWKTEAEANIKGASVPTYKAVNGEIPAACRKVAYEYICEYATRQYERVSAILLRRLNKDAAANASLVEARAKYAADIATYTAKVSALAEEIENTAALRKAEREMKETQIVRDGRAAYVDNAAEKAGTAWDRKAERVKARDEKAAAATAKAA